MLGVVWSFWFLLSLEPAFGASLSYLKEPKRVFRELGLNELFDLFEKSSGPGDLQGSVIYYRSPSWIAVGWQDEKGAPFFVISENKIIRIYFQNKRDVPVEIQSPDYLELYHSASNEENPCVPDTARVPSPNPLSLEWHLELIRLSRQACRLVSWIEKTQIYK